MLVSVELQIQYFLGVLIPYFVRYPLVTDIEEKKTLLRIMAGSNYGNDLEYLVNMSIGVESKDEAKEFLFQLQRTDIPSSSFPITHVHSFEDAILALTQHDLIDSTNVQYSRELLKDILGCRVGIEFQGREQQINSAMIHIATYSKTDEEINSQSLFRTPYLLVFGLPGSGKSRFLYEIGNRSNDNNYLVLACTFNHTTHYVDTDEIGLNIPEFPVVARLLFQYARKDKYMKWSTWCKNIFELEKKYHLITFLNLKDVIRLLKTKYLKSKAVLLIDETHQFIQREIYSEQDMLNFMRGIISVQDYGIAVIFSVFVTILAQEEALRSTRLSNSLNMDELSFQHVKNILLTKQIQNYITPISTALRLDLNETINLLYSCIGGIPRVIDGLYCEMLNSRYFDLLSIIDAVGRFVASQYPPPSFDLIMAAFSNTKLSETSTIKIEFKDFTLRKLQICGYCQTLNDPNSGIGIIFPCTELFAAVYSSNYDHTFPEDPTFRVIFRQVLKDLLIIPIIRGHNIWEEFMRRLFIIRSLRYMTPTNISLGELFHPAIQFNDCLTNTRIIMKNIHPKAIRFFYPPSPRAITQTPSIWFPYSQFESDFDTLMFFNRATESSISTEELTEEVEVEVVNPSNFICVGIQNKWSENDQTKISYSAMRKALNHFRSKMRARGWDDSQLYFIFIINQSIHTYILTDHNNLFNEQIGIISSTNNVLDKWLAPTVKLIVNRFQALAKHYPNHEISNENMTQDEIDEYHINSKRLFNSLTDADNEDLHRKKHFREKKEKKRSVDVEQTKTTKMMKIS